MIKHCLCPQEPSKVMREADMPTNNYSVIIQEAQKKELNFLSQNLGGCMSLIKDQLLVSEAEPVANSFSLFV